MFSFGGGQLPSFGRPQQGGQQQMQPLGQMWQQPQQPSGQLPTMGGPQMQPMGQQQQGQQVGMVPGVPGSMGLNPGGQQQGFGGQQGFGQFMQGPQFQNFMQGHPQFQDFMSRMQSGNSGFGGQIMRPMGA